MNETWTQEPIGPRLYGESIYGNSYFGSIEFTEETTIPVTWTNLTDAALTWTDVFSDVTNTVVISGEQGVTSSSIQDDTGDGGTGGYFGNWLNNGGTGAAGQIPITSFDSNDGLRVSLDGTIGGNNFLTGSNPSGGLPDNDKIIFWGDDLPSNLVAGTVYYVKQTSDATKINLRTASGGNYIAYVDSGSGTNYCSTTFFEATGGTGSGFIGTYGINEANGIIYSVNIIASGNYTVLPTSFIATCPGTRFHYQGYSGAPACNTANVTFSGGNLDLIFTDTNHTLLDGEEIQFIATDTLPGNITTDTNYYVNDKTGTTFRVETVVGGGNVQYSSTLGSGVSYKEHETTATWSEETTNIITWAEV